MISCHRQGVGKECQIIILKKRFRATLQLFYTLNIFLISSTLIFRFFFIHRVT